MKISLFFTCSLRSPIRFRLTSFTKENMLLSVQLSTSTHKYEYYPGYFNFKLQRNQLLVIVSNYTNTFLYVLTMTKLLKYRMRKLSVETMDPFFFFNFYCFFCTFEMVLHWRKSPLYSHFIYTCMCVIYTAPFLV